MAVNSCSQAASYFTDFYLDPQSKDFVCLSQVDRGLRDSCSKINPIINEKLFCKKLVGSIPEDYLVSLNLLESLTLSIIIERIRKRVSGFFSKNYSPLCEEFSEGYSVPGRGCVFTLKGSSDSPYSPGALIQKLDWNLVTLKLMDLFRSYHFLCERDVAPFTSLFCGAITLIVCKDLRKIASDWPFPNVELCELPPNRLKAPHLVASLEAQKLTDVAIQPEDGGGFGAHKLILSTGSEVFDAMFNGKMKEVSKVSFPEDAKTVKAFITYFYNAVDPFTQKDASSINAVALLGIADRYAMKDLVVHCQTHIVHNASQKDWKWIGELGVLYKNTYLVKVANSLRLCRGDSLSPNMKADCKELGIPCPSSALQEVCVKCTLESGETLAIRFDTGDALRWLVSKRFTQTAEGWRGDVPVGKDFRFIRISPNGRVEGESGKERRHLLENEYVEITDVRFPSGVG